MYDELVKALRYCILTNPCELCPYYSADGPTEKCSTMNAAAADAIEERDKAALTIQHEMVAEAESHIALVERLSKQVEELELHYCRHAIRNVHDRGDDSLCAKHGCEVSALPRWIPVTEEPPLKVGDDRYNGYLVLANGFCEVADYTVDESGVLCFFVDGEYEPDVTHFMPIPKLPKLDGGRGNV